LREVLDPAGGAFRIIFVIFDLKAFGEEEALLDRDAPGTFVGIAVALQTYGSGHWARSLAAKFNGCA
jgi:hypothetical protein